MTLIKTGQWKGWTQTDKGFKKIFGKLEVESKGGCFYVDGKRYWTLKECLDDN
jgi:hypothetical protein